ncbi:hypothetical protein L596_005544 [Steinernema carpocapsae]|uniref:Uncharacterized protein n=1 Tax=Steinernema carpocapsae TaxID=34508 RepID=A0A4U8UZL0_STECR|nr:hypothetical protein L596_005544 [Steinernema carpocapsae]
MSSSVLEVLTTRLCLKMVCYTLSKLNVRFDHIRHFMICGGWMVEREYQLPLEQCETVHINALEPLLKYRFHVRTRWRSLLVHRSHVCQAILVANGITPMCTNLLLYYNCSASLMLFERQNMNKLVFLLKGLTFTGSGHGFTVAMMHRRIDRHLDVTAELRFGLTAIGLTT